MRDTVLFLAPLLLAIPFAVGPALRQAEFGSLRLIVGWEAAPLTDGPLAVAFFYVTNLGIPFVLALVAVAVAALRRELPARWFLLAWMTSLFLVPNVLQGSSISFDMNKYFQAMWVAVAILAAWLMARWPRPVVAVALAASVLSPALVATWFVIGRPVVLTAAQERASHWIEANTPERTVFLTDDWVSSPVDLAGRLRITTFGPYVENLGYAPDARASDVWLAYCGGDAAAAEVMARYRATYAITPSTPIDCVGAPPTAFEGSLLFETVYSDHGVSVWRLRTTGQP
jgi:hypothetical protein